MKRLLTLLLFLLAGPVLAQTANTTVAIEPAAQRDALDLTTSVRSADSPATGAAFWTARATPDTFFVPDSNAARDTTMALQVFNRMQLLFDIKALDSLAQADSIGVKARAYAAFVHGETLIMGETALGTATFTDIGPHIWNLDTLVSNADIGPYMVITFEGILTNGSGTRVYDVWLWRDRRPWRARNE